MSDHSSPGDGTRVAPAGDSDATVKAPWHPPTLEEIDYSATGTVGTGANADMVFITASQGP